MKAKWKKFPSVSWKFTFSSSALSSSSVERSRLWRLRWWTANSAKTQSSLSRISRNSGKHSVCPVHFDANNGVILAFFCNICSFQIEFSCRWSILIHGVSWCVGDHFSPPWKNPWISQTSWSWEAPTSQAGTMAGKIMSSNPHPASSRPPNRIDFGSKQTDLEGSQSKDWQIYTVQFLA